MNLLDSLKISASALNANKVRMNAISSNIANAQTTRTPEGGPYRRKEVVFGSEPVRDSFSEILEGELGEKSQTVNATEVVSTDRAPIPKYEPGHPDADENGIVYYPNINVMEEMANMISATRSYEANVATIQAIKAMANKALEIGR